MRGRYRRLVHFLHILIQHRIDAYQDLGVPILIPAATVSASCKLSQLHAGTSSNTAKGCSRVRYLETAEPEADGLPLTALRLKHFQLLDRLRHHFFIGLHGIS